MGTMTFVELGITFGINLAITAAFLFAYSLFSLQPFNARVYFTAWFMKDDKKASVDFKEGQGNRKLAYSWKAYIHSLDWMYVALRKPERELLEHAGLDMVVYLRMFKLGFKIFVPVMALAFVILFPVYYTSDYLSSQPSSFGASNIEFFTISNLQDGSPRYWAPCLLAWVFNLWALHLMREEYKAMSQLRLDYLSDQKKAPNQFTVLVRQVPHDNTRTVAQKTAQFFSIVHKDQYLMTTPVFDARSLSKLEAEKEWTENRLTALEIGMEKKPGWHPQHRTKCLGLWGELVDSVEFFEGQLQKLNKEIAKERDRIVNDKDAIMPANFVSFKTRWGAAVAAQTQQSKDNTKWITTWAPEPEDVCWANLPMNYLSLTTRRAVAGLVVIATVIFYMLPISAVQGLASLENLNSIFPWLVPITSLPFVNAFLTSFLPGLALMIFLAVLPICLRILSRVEGYVSNSQIERAAAGKMFYFIVFSVFLSNVLFGTVWSKISYYLQYYFQNPAQIPSALGSAITSNANFFMTYTMLNGWSAVAGEVTRITPLILFHIKNMLLVRTPLERKKAMSSSGPDYVSLLPLIELYFLLSFMFWVLAPLYLPFAAVFFVFGYVVYRNQFINVYTAEYDMRGGYWPHFHVRALACMVLAQICLICVFALRQVLVQTIFLLPLPVVSILYHMTFIAAAFEPTFERYALEEAVRKDTIDAVVNPHDNPRVFLARQYLHPSLRAAYELTEEEEVENAATDKVCILQSDNSEAEARAGAPLVPVKRHPRSRGMSPLHGTMQSRGGSPVAVTKQVEQPRAEADKVAHSRTESSSSVPATMPPADVDAASDASTSQLLQEQQ